VADCPPVEAAAGPMSSHSCHEWISFATPRPRLRDAGPLRAFRAEYGKAARAGLLLHTGSTLEWLAPDVLAVPWWRVC